MTYVLIDDKSCFSGEDLRLVITKFEAWNTAVIQRDIFANQRFTSII